MDPGDRLVALVDERRLRKRLGRADVNIELLSTRGFFRKFENDLGRGDALAIWRLVLIANPLMDPIDETLIVRNVRGDDDTPSPPPPLPPCSR